MLLIRDLVKIDAADHNALNRLQPLLLNQRNQGGTWRKHGKARPPALWPLVEWIIAECCAAG